MVQICIKNNLTLFLLKKTKIRPKKFAQIQSSSYLKRKPSKWCVKVNSFSCKFSWSRKA